MNKKLITVLLLATVLRLFFLDKFPIGLNADEAAIGYNTYSLIETGKDEHGVSWPLVFRSFDDYKPPLYFYLCLPFVKILGLSEWAVRLPSALLGIASVYLTYLLVIKLFPKKDDLALISALVLTISPWHLHFSRGGWEVNAATFFILFGLIGFLSNQYSVFVFSLVASLYTYHSARIVAPLIALSLTIIYFKKINWKQYFIFATIGILVTLPIIFQMISGGGTSRFNGVSIFSDSGPLSWVHEMRRVDPHPESIITKIKYNRYSAYAGKFISNYFSHFSPKFLFISGDVIDRSRVPGIGQSYLVLLPFFYIGVIYLLSQIKQTYSQVILVWLFISPIAASITYQSPHALRAENMVIPMSIITGQGLYFFFNIIKSRFIKIIPKIIGIILSLVLLSEFCRYLYQYYVVYPKQLPVAWQYGFKNLGQYLKEHGQEYKQVIISTQYDQPYILVAFYTQYPPQKLQDELIMSSPDQYGFSTGLSFANYTFKKINYQEDNQKQDSLIVSATEDIDPKSVFQTISYNNGSPILKLIKTSTLPVVP